jgi:hypothetical protein
LLACARAWWRDFPEIFASEFPGYENDAVTIRTSAPLILPGLLQTQAYMESMLGTEFRPPAWRRKALSAHLRRQEILNGTHGIALSAVITEASLRCKWGPYSDRREQLGHLIEIAGRSNVHLRIQRFDDGPPIGVNSIINIFGFDGGNPDIVFIETGHAIEEVGSRKLASGHMRSFHDACEGALDPDDTLRYLKRLTRRAHHGSQQVILASSRYQETRDLLAESSSISSADAENSAAEKERTFDASASPNIDRISVAAYVDGSRFAMRQVLSKVDKLVQTLGYGDPFDEDIEQGSIFRKCYARHQPRKLDVVGRKIIGDRSALAWSAASLAASHHAQGVRVREGPEPARSCSVNLRGHRILETNNRRSKTWIGRPRTKAH